VVRVSRGGLLAGWVVAGFGWRGCWGMVGSDGGEACCWCILVGLVEATRVWNGLFSDGWAGYGCLGEFSFVLSRLWDGGAAGSWFGKGGFRPGWSRLLRCGRAGYDATC
jgi:hypothetical protein